MSDGKDVGDGVSGGGVTGIGEAVAEDRVGFGVELAAVGDSAGVGRGLAEAVAMVCLDAVGGAMDGVAEGDDVPVHDESTTVESTARANRRITSL